MDKTLKTRSYTNEKYQGNVLISLKLRNGNAIELSKHNNGLLTLSKAFALYLCNNKNSSAYIPQFIDLQWIENPSIVDNINNLDNWKTFLRKPISLSGLSYTLDSAAYREVGDSAYQKNWVAEVTARIPFSLLQSSVQAESTSLFRLYLLTSKLTNDPLTDTRLCYVTISPEELSKLETGTEMMISWKLQLVHVPVTTE